MITNILTIDLEDFYCDQPFSTWPKYKNRVVQTATSILNLLEAHKIDATFFTVGYIAQRHPELLEKVISKGHEIGSHSYSHGNIKKMAKQDFEKDLVHSLEILRKVSGERILGFRAPYFSISKENLWAFDVLRKHVRYDSSVFPVRFHYGFHEAPRYIYRMSEKNPLRHDEGSDFFELPMTTLRLPVAGNFPVAGGIYLRLWPSYLIKTGIEKLNKAGFPAVLYIHPKDLDRATPRLPGDPWHSYLGLNGAAKKFESVLKEFKFSSAREVISL
jgi:polysaccharide deacetylase family protein (PEP-CTERM system associated)